MQIPPRQYKDLSESGLISFATIGVCVFVRRLRLAHFFYLEIIMEKNTIKEIFYATEDCKNVEIDKNSQNYKDLKEKELAFKEVLNYDAFDKFEQFMQAYKKVIEECNSVYYERGFKRGADTILSVMKK